MPRNRLEELQAAALQSHQLYHEEDEDNYSVSSNNKNKKGRRKTPPAMPSAAPMHMEMGYLPTFLATMERVVNNISQVESNTTELRQVHSKILSSATKDELSERRMADLMAENKKLAVDIRRDLQREQDELLNEKRSKEWDLKRTQVSAQSSRFLTVWSTYNTDQLEYRDRCKRLLVKRCQITDSDLSEEQIETMLDEGKTAAVFSAGILDRERLFELQDRHEELVKLEKSITEVHEMFVEVAALVKQQGEVVDRIEDHVTDAGVSVEQGVTMLKMAEKFKGAARRKRCCLIGCGVSTLLIVILIIVLATVLPNATG